jgi:hypothetical protein
MRFRHVFATLFGGSLPTSMKRPNSRKRRTRMLELECLENRIVPTIVYKPVFGPETTSQDGSEHMQQPQVYLVFWGGYWVSDGAGQVQSVINAASNVVTSTFPLITDQYGADGSGMSIAGVVFDSSTPTNGSFGGGDINDVVQNQIDNNALPESDAFNGNDHSKMYVVITPPNFLSNSPSAVGFNQVKSDTDVGFGIDVDDIGECWVWSGSDPHNFVNLDQFSLTFSHEVAEIMSDLDGEGYEVNPPAFAPPGEGNQIGDYEGNSYAFHLSNGVDVQPVWSRSDNAWAVDDGTTQNFYLDGSAGWTFNPSDQSFHFDQEYALTLQGDQNGSPADDTVTIDQVASGPQKGGVQVTQNGETVSFDPGQISHITVNMKDGNDTINVESVVSGVPVTINLGSGHDVVNISPSAGNLDTIQTYVTVNAGNGSGTLNVYDQNNFNDATWILDAGNMTRTNAAAIYYNGLFNSLNINGGRGNVVYQVNGTQPAFPTTVSAGTNNSAQFLIEGTTGPFVANLGSGVESVIVSPLAQNLDNISGNVTVNGLPGNQTNTLVVNDQNNGNSANWEIEGSSVLRDSASSLLISYKNLADLEVRGGFGGNSFNVTPIGQNLDILPNIFSITGRKPADSLTLNDQANKRFATWSITGANVTRRSITVFPLQVVDSVNYSHIGNLIVNGGSGGNAFDLSPTAMNLDELPADVTVNGGGSPSAVSNTAILDDQNNANFSTWTVDGSRVDRSYTRFIFLQGNIIRVTVTETIHYSNLSSLVLNGGSGGSEFDLTPSSQDLDKLLATVTVNGGGSADSLNVFDQSNPNASLWNISSTSLDRTWLEVINLGNLIFDVPITSTINYSSLTSLTVYGGGTVGSAGNTFNITGTPAPTSVDSGIGNDQVNVQGSANPLSINGDFGNNTLVGANVPNTWSITGANSGTVGAVKFSNFQNLVGGSAGNTFQFHTGGSLDGTLNGGGGVNTLDYSGYTGGITVDLPLHLAGLVHQMAANSVFSIQNVTGSQGNDLLVGDANPNVLIGGTGRNVIIGGAGGDTLNAGPSSDDNILIAGTTAWDMNLPALQAVMAEWTRTDLGYADRFKHLAHGGTGAGAKPLNKVNGQLILLNKSTVFADSSPDTLTGGAAVNATNKTTHDWFFVDLDDVITNLKKPADHVTKV